MTRCTTSSQFSRQWAIAVIAALALLLGACADSADDATTSSGSEPGTTETTDAASTTGSSDSAGTTAPSSSESIATSSTSTTTSTATTTGGSTTLPGEEFIGYVADGDVLGVVAVRHDDVLNIRALPGTGQTVVATASPTDADLVATGRGRLLPGSIWWEVQQGATTGWANSRFLGHVARTDDVTSDFLATYGDTPEAETLVQLGELVAAEFASEDPPSRIVPTVAPSVGDLGEVTYDVIGLGDDSILGFRLHVFAVEGDGGESWVLRTIEQTMFCARGTSGEICV